MILRPRLLVCCQDVPYPPTHGGRIEMWSRFEAWRQLGASLHVVFWSTESSAASVAVEALESLGCTSTVLVRTRSLRSVWGSELPPLAFSMQPSPRWYPQLCALARVLETNAVVLENWPAAITAFALSEDLGIPLLYRSQNVEVAYWREVHQAARGLGRLRLGLTARRVGRLERAVRTAASAVLDISQDDASEAEARGMLGRSMVLPPVWKGDDGGRLLPFSAMTETVDLAFGGSLWPPHHVEGIRWFLESVLPIVRRAASRTITVRIFGSRPTAALLELAAASDVEVRADVGDFRLELQRAKVLINPVRRSSGINMKMLELLTCGRAVVSTTAGVRGLSHDVRELARVADTPEDFAAAVVSSLDCGPLTDADSSVATVLASYGASAQHRFLADVVKLPLAPVGKLAL